MGVNPAIENASTLADHNPRKSTDTLHDDIRNTALNMEQNQTSTTTAVTNPANNEIDLHICDPPGNEPNLPKHPPTTVAAVQRPADVSLLANRDAQPSIKATACTNANSLPDAGNPRKPVQKSIRKLRRTTIGAEALVVLASSYKTHFAKYSKGRKKVIQKVPAAVWKCVYSDYLTNQRAKCEAIGELLNKDKLPQERTLQDELRDTLNEISTGVSDEATAVKARVQDEDLTMRMKTSDTYNKKKMCQIRESLVSTTSNKNTADNGLIGGAREVESGGLPDVPKKVMTKKEIMEGAVSAINDMVQVVENSSIELYTELCKVLTC